MRIGTIEVKRRVWIGIGFALVVTGAWWVWTQARQHPVVAMAPGERPFVRLAGSGKGRGDQVLRERSELFDPTPLFFPTEWNFGQLPLRETMRRQPGQVFASFDANLTFGDQNIKVYGAEAATVPERLTDVLTQGNEAPFAGMGQIDVQRPALPERDGYLEVRTLGNEEIIMKQVLKNILLPHLDFAPAEYLLAVSSAGVVGDPILLVSLGREEVDEKADAFFRSYLVKTLRLGERLNPGRYRVLVGP